jgi:hypothetical protein
VNEFAGLPLTVKEHPRARRVLVKLVPNKGLEVVTPPGFNPRFLPAILDEKRYWIERTRDRLTKEGRDLSGRPPALPDAMDYKAVGRVVRLGYLDRPGPVKLLENGARLQVSGPLNDREAVFETLCKHTAKKARETLLPMLRDMSRRTGLTYSALRIRRQKTRWGSCSARGTISLNAKLMFLPPLLVNHLLLHELCHTKHLNHSRQYWACVAQYEPDYRRLEDEVKFGGKYVPGWFG